MRESLSSAKGEHAIVGQYASFYTFMRKYNLLAAEAAKLLPRSGLIDVYDLTRVKGWANCTWPEQKSHFDNVSVNVAMLRSLLETSVGFIEDESQALRDFLQANLRKAIFSVPEKEIEVQNAVESLLVGRGMLKGSGYDRETGRVKHSGKESVPDFIVLGLRLCLEVKLSKSKQDLKSIVDEINADIRAYGQSYESQIFIVYDLSTIRDESEFKKDIENARGVSVLVVKH